MKNPASPGTVQLDASPSAEPLGPRSVHRLFERQAELRPEAVAVTFRGAPTRFAELDRLANRLARFLRRRGVGPETLVGVCLPPSTDRVVALLGILKAGGAFAPIAPTAPITAGRRGAALRAAVRPALVLSAEPLGGDGVIVLEQAREAIGSESGEGLEDVSGPESLACVVDGGAERGLLVEHRHLLNRLEWLQAEIELSDSDTLLHGGGDGADWEIFWPLLHAGRLAIADGPGPEAIREHGATVLRLTPARLAALVADRAAPLGELRAVLCGGEPLRSGLAATFAERSPARLVHLYSPPEAAAEVCFYTPAAREGRDRLPVGDTFNLSVFLLDPYLQPVPQDLPGEIHLAFEELPRGFLGDPCATALSFLPDPFAEEPGSRLLRTGDLGRLLPDGALALIGAAGRQAWIGGRRLDLGAMEAALLAEPSIEEAVLLVRETAAAAQLVAYLVVSGAWAPERHAERLLSRWPEELLPAAWVPLSRLPLTPSGRLDEAALLGLPVIDAELAARWEESLLSLPEVEEAAVLVRETSEAPPPVHLDDLLPGWSSTGARPALDAASGAEQPAPVPVAAAAAPAVRHGAALELPADAPATLAGALERSARLYPENGITYLRRDGTEAFQTYPELLEAAERLLAGLRSLGLAAGDKVLFQLDGLEDFVVAFWASMLGGFVPVPLSPAPTYDQPNTAVLKLANAWRMLDRPLILSGRGLLPAVRSLSGLLGLDGLRVAAVDDLRRHEPDRERYICQEDDLALLLLTSGSTGLPKAVMQTHRALLTRSAAAARHNAFTPADVSLNWMPLDHVGGIVMFHLRDVYVGCRQVQAPTATVLEDPLRWLDWIERFRATVTWAPNFAFGLVNERAEEIARRRWDLSSMRFILNGGEAIVARTARTFLRLLQPHALPGSAMKPAWGMSETCSGITYSHGFSLDSTRDSDPFVEVGVPVPEASVRIADAEDRVVAEGTVGRLQVKGPMVTSGYYRNPELDRESFTADGWFDTGDLGVLRDGRLSITGRAKDVIIIHGINHYSHEIEAVVEEVAGVEVSYTAACPVRGAGSDTDELAIFFHTLHEDWERRIELIREIRDRVAERSGLNPAWVIPMAREDIPKTAIGKIQRAQLRRQLETGKLAEVLKRIDLLTGSARTLPAWFHHRVWRPRKPAARQAARPAGRWLVFLDPHGLGADLCRRLERRGQAWITVEAGEEYRRLDARRFVLDPCEDGHYRRLLQSLTSADEPIGRVVHLWACGEPAGAAGSLEALRRAQEQGVYSVLSLVQALIAAQGEQTPVELTVVSSQAQITSPGDRLAAAGASLPGLLKTIPLELPAIRCRHIDLETGGPDAEGRRLLRELELPAGEAEVAYRGGQRLVPALVGADLLLAERGEMPIATGGLYLVTGGLGGIGGRLALLLHESFGARLLLIGRTALPEPEQWPRHLAAAQTPLARRLSAHLALSRAGADFIYRAVDVTDLDGLRQAVAGAEAAWQRPLDGIFHLAGEGNLEYHWTVADRRRVATETRQSFEMMFAAKVYGTWTLGQLLEERPQALFVAFSSVNSLFGGSTVSAYSAANSFLDAFTLHLRYQARRRACCFNWSMWDSLGMSRGNPVFARDAANAAGYHILSPEQGLCSLLAGLERDQARLVVGLDGDNHHMRHRVLAEACSRVELTAFFTGAAEDLRLRELAVQDRFGTATSCALHRLPGMPRALDGGIDRERLIALSEKARSAGPAERVAPQTGIERELAGIWQQVLGTRSPVGTHDNFFHLGGDSILSIQIVARAAEKGLRLTPKQIFQHPTIAELATVAETSGPRLAEQDLVEGEVPLTPIQRWFFEQELPDPHHFNMALLFEARRPLDGGLLARAAAHLALHHDALRMRYRRAGDGWQQVNAGVEEPRYFSAVDLSAEPPSARTEAITAAAARLQASLSLADGPLLRMAYFDLGLREPGRLLIVIHHLVVDGVSWRILLQDLQTAYAHLQAGAEVRLPPKTSSFQLWSERLNELGRSGALAAEAPYWLAEPRRRIPLLPVDAHGGRDTEGSSRTVSVHLDEEETRALLQEAPKAYRTRIDDVLLTALAQVLTAWTRTSAVLIDLEGHGREELFDDVDLSRTVGWFTTLYPVLLDLDAGAAPGAALKSIKEQLRGIPRHGIGYGLLRYRSDGVAAALASLPPAEVSFNYLGQFDALLAESEAFAVAREPIGDFRHPDGERRHRLDVFAHVVEGRLEIGWIYSRGVHRDETVEHLAQGFLAALRALVAHCLSSGAGGATPSDFPLAGLGQEQIDRLTGDVLDIRDVRGVADVYPLSPTQQGLLFHTLYSPESGVYFDQMSCTLKGALDIAAFEQAWRTVIDRHAILRTGFVWEGFDRPLQVVRFRVDLPLRLEDWRRTPPGEAGLAALRAEERELGFDLARAPLMRLTLIRLDDERFHFVWSSHHLLLDGWSRALVLKEVFACYEARRHGRQPVLGPAFPYRDYVAWLERQSLEEAEAYWRRTLAGFTTATRVAGTQRPGAAAGPGGDYAAEDLRLAPDLTARLQAQAQRHQLTLNTVVQGAWGRLLYGYGGERDVVFGATFSGRPAALPGVESTVGLFINTLPVRMTVPDDEPLLGWLRRLQEQEVERRQYEHTPLFQVQGWSEVAAGQPLFETLYVFENFPVDASLRTGVGSLEIEGVDLFERTNYPLTLAAIPGDGLALQIFHDTARFDRPMVRRLLGQLATFLAGVAEGLERRVGDVPLLSAAERRELVTGWNATAAEYDRTALIHDRVAAQAARRGDAPAVASGGGQERRHLTYGELDQRANRLARRLLALGAGPEVPVALCLERSPGLIVAQLAVLKAGAAYVPLDPEWPAERLAFVLGDCGAPVVLTREPLAARLPATGARVVLLDAEREAPDRGEPGDPRVPMVSAQLAYVIYTSGSAGRPKGVGVTHAALANLIAWHQRAHGVTAADRATQLAGLAFDASVWEVWPYLTAGALLCLPDEEALALPGSLIDYLVREEVTITFLPTPLAEAVMQEPWPAETALRRLLTGGDQLHFAPREGHPWLLVNQYGPTENTVVSTWAEVPAGTAGTPPIGWPIDNVQAYVLDRDLRLVPAGAAGELAVGGDSLARGYLGRPALTAEKLVPDPWSGRSGARLYRTGDLVRHRSDGSLEFVGRIDHQVKVRGYRVELGEIEAVLGEHPAVRAAAVLARNDGDSGARRLVAYVVQDPGQAVEAGGLRDFLSRRLPGFMVPAVFVQLEALPLTANGKIDRRALPAPERAQLPAFAAPRTELERRLAAIWSEALGVGRVGIDDSFFALGGDSISAIKVLSHARQAGLRLTPRQLFEHPTLAELALVVETAVAGANADFTARELAGFKARLREAGLATEAVESAYPLSPLQHGMLFHALNERATAMYFEQLYATFRGALDPEAFGRAWQRIVDRTPELRTAFVWRGLAEPLQAVHRSCELPLDRLAWLDAAPEEQELRFAGHLAADRERGCELSRPPLMRLSLIQLAPDTWRFVWSVHHLLVDGWSLPLVLHEVFAAYEALRRGQEPPADRPRPPYRSYIAWLAQQDPARAEAYWRRQLAGVQAPTPLGLDRPAGAAPERTGQERRGEQQTRLDPAASGALRELARRLGLTLNTLMQGAWALLLAGYSGTDDVVFGTTVSGRPPQIEGVESMLGMLINTLPVRVRIEPGMPFLAWLAQLQAAQAEAREHEHAPLVDVHGWSGVPRNQPLFESLLVFENTPMDGSLGRILTDVEVSGVGFSERSSYPLTWVVGPFEEILILAFYDRERIADDTVTQVLEHWRALLLDIAARPGVRTGEIGVLAAAEGGRGEGFARARARDKAEEFNF